MSSRVAVKAALLALAFMLVILGISAYSLSVDRNNELTDSLAFGCAVASELLESAEDDAQRLVAAGGQGEGAVVAGGVVLAAEGDTDLTPLGGGLGSGADAVELGADQLPGPGGVLYALEPGLEVGEHAVADAELYGLLLRVVRDGDDMEPHQRARERSAPRAGPDPGAESDAEREQHGYFPFFKKLSFHPMYLRAYYRRRYAPLNTRA